MEYIKKPISVLLRSSSTVFSLKEIALLWGDSKKRNVFSAVNYYVKKSELYHIKKGFYGKNKDYDPLEFATKLYTPCYISFETVLLQEGVIFQYDETIYAASYLSREIKVDGRNYRYRRLQEEILLNSTGIEKKNNYFMASKERAFLDMVYLMGSRHFDHLDRMDWEKCFEIVQIYNNKTLIKLLNSYYKDFKADSDVET